MKHSAKRAAVLAHCDYQSRAAYQATYRLFDHLDRIVKRTVDVAIELRWSVCEPPAEIDGMKLSVTVELPADHHLLAMLKKVIDRRDDLTILAIEAAYGVHIYTSPNGIVVKECGDDPTFKAGQVGL